MILLNPLENECTIYCDECYENEENFDYEDDPTIINKKLQELGWLVFHKKIQITICPVCAEKRANTS